MPEGVFRTPTTACPGCGQTLDAAGGLAHETAPRPGDLTVCSQCYRTLIFNAELVPRDLTPAEQAILEADAERQLELERTRLMVMAYWPRENR